MPFLESRFCARERIIICQEIRLCRVMPLWV
jgi:hypothetical protein